MCHSGLRPGGCELELSLRFFVPQILRFAARPRGPDFIVGITTCHCCRAYDSLISLMCNIHLLHVCVCVCVSGLRFRSGVL